MLWGGRRPGTRDPRAHRRRASPPGLRSKRAPRSRSSRTCTQQADDAVALLGRARGRRPRSSSGAARAARSRSTWRFAIRTVSRASALLEGGGLALSEGVPGATDRGPRRSRSSPRRRPDLEGTVGETLPAGCRRRRRLGGAARGRAGRVHGQRPGDLSPKKRGGLRGRHGRAAGFHRPPDAHRRRAGLPGGVRRVERRWSRPPFRRPGSSGSRGGHIVNPAHPAVLAFVDEQLP